MKVWITKYALTDGISEGEIIAKHSVLECGMIESKIKYLCKNADGDHFYLESDDFCDSLEYALKKAEEMRQKKIASLKKQIENLSLRGFARQCDMPSSTMCRLLNGQTEPSKSTIDKILTVTGLSYEQCFREG